MLYFWTMRFSSSLVLLGALIGFCCTMISCNKGKNNPDSCNGSSTRRDVKLAIDGDAGEIDTIAIVATVDSLGGIDLPEADSDTPRQEIEKQVFSVTGEVHKLSKHRDGDWKVKLISDNEKYLNCEAPNPGCEFASDSPFYDQFLVVRDWIETHQDDLEGKIVTIEGVAFIDIDHKYPRNAAENEIELHPILDIRFE